MSLTVEQCKKIAEKYVELYRLYSREPIAIDRLDPAYRVGTSELFDHFPELHLKLPDMIEIEPYIKRAMKFKLNQKFKLKWRVGLVPVGKYRSFERRAWPTADYPEERTAVALYCEESYTPALARAGQHSEITIRVADHSVSPFVWRTLKRRAQTLDEAKQIAEKFIEQHPEYRPKELS